MASTTVVRVESNRTSKQWAMVLSCYFRLECISISLVCVWYVCLCDVNKDSYSISFTI